MRWTDKDMLKFARVASGGSYGDYRGCKSLKSKLKKYKLMSKMGRHILAEQEKELNKHRQVKGVDSKTNIDIYSVDNEIVSMPNITALMMYLVKTYSNDTDLGKQVRNTVLSWKEKK